MPKVILCAQCGAELAHTQKAIKAQHRVVTVVEPHVCEGMTELEIKEADKFKPSNEERPKLAGDYDFIKHVDETNVQIETPTMLGDNRDKDHLRKEVTTTAPGGIIANVNAQSGKGSLSKTDPRDRNAEGDEGDSIEMEG